ncbi:MerR family transcriptional regulator [Streptomyces sp. CBMA152]|uniref:MerR family transcriptional regulator n=1 Tax=Streptomyces sp. CBMA152 TaxID=1896312 RepID=UPI0016608A93|nr:MerR family transcriptional regulator [Streptomyces sp. CBMA152]
MALPHSRRDIAALQTGAPSHRLLTTREAARVAGVKISTIRQWQRRGYLTPIARYRTTNLYREDHVLRAERARRTGKTQTSTASSATSAGFEQ